MLGQGVVVVEVVLVEDVEIFAGAGVVFYHPLYVFGIIFNSDYLVVPSWKTFLAIRSITLGRCWSIHFKHIISFRLTSITLSKLAGLKVWTSSSANSGFDTKLTKPVYSSVSYTSN